MPAGMNLTPLYAWQNAERRVYDYLVNKLGANDGTTAFLEEYGKFAPEAEFWKFQISGPGDGQMVPVPFWSFDAEFEGVYKSRSSAQQAWGRLAVALGDLVQPGVLEGVISVRYGQKPNIERVVMKANQDEAATGGEVRRWRITVPMVVDFVNSEPEIAGESNDTRND